MSETINIETSDLAYSLDKVSDSVDKTTAAVVGVGGSLCAAERESADKVCKGVNRGFFTLIMSQLLQKKVKVQSDAESHLLTLRHFAQSLRRIKQQLWVDYERITQRYSRLFKTLGDSLKSRVFTLDGPAVDVAIGDFGTQSNRMLNSGAPSALLQDEFVSSSSDLVAVRCKRDCQKVFDGVKLLMTHGAELNRAMDAIARDVHHDVVHPIFIPVMVAETTDLFLTDGTRIDVVAPECGVKTKITNAVFEAASRCRWVASSAAENSEVAARILRLVEKTNVSEREKALVKQLVHLSKWSVMEV